MRLLVRGARILRYGENPYPTGFPQMRHGLTVADGLDQRRRRASSPAHASAAIQFSAIPEVEHPVDEEFTGMAGAESLPFGLTPASGRGAGVPASTVSFVPASPPAVGGGGTGIGTTAAATPCRNEASPADR